MHFNETLKKERPSPEDMLFFLETGEPEAKENLFKKAYEIKLKYVGNTVYFRGIIEISNICTKNCLYCGIRKDNKNFSRYTMSKDEILKMAQWAYENKYGSVVLQSGERQDRDFTNFVTDIIREIKNLSDNNLGITLSLGEQTEDVYRQWFQTGAHRYLLRIETSNPVLYKQLHPENHDFEARIKCLENLREAGYQVGTGVMIGLPGQTSEDLVSDILFYEKMNIDMIGMGPYVLHKDTPLSGTADDSEEAKLERFNKSLVMIALTRWYLQDVNIASTTALQTLDPIGREKGLLAGANIIMPIMTPLEYREKYVLYDGKPCLKDTADECRNCLKMRIEGIGESIGYNNWGDSPHFSKKVVK
jgi:biotin synthase